MSHKTAVETIVRYLIQTKDKGIILNPTKFLEIDLFVDSGSWQVKDKTIPDSVKCINSFVIMLSDHVPIFWLSSKLQTE